jgi:hypothetical protein
MIYFLIVSHFQVIKFQFSSELNLDFFFVSLECFIVFCQDSADEMPAATGQGIVKKKASINYRTSSTRAEIVETFPKSNRKRFSKQIKNNKIKRRQRNIAKSTEMINPKVLA